MKRRVSPKDMSHWPLTSTHKCTCDLTFLHSHTHAYILCTTTYVKIKSSPHLYMLKKLYNLFLNHYGQYPRAVLYTNLIWFWSLSPILTAQLCLSWLFLVQLSAVHCCLLRWSYRRETAVHTQLVSCSFSCISPGSFFTSDPTRDLLPSYFSCHFFIVFFPVILSL